MRKHMRLGMYVATLALAAAACGDKASTEMASTSAVANAVGQDAAAPSPPTVVSAAAAESPREERAMRDGMTATGAVAGRMAGASARFAGRTDLVLGSGALPSAPDMSGAMLIRQGEAALEVRSIDDGVAKLRQTAAQFGGFVANTTLRNGRDEQRGATLEVRVPAGQFEALVGALGSLGKVESVTASAQDVGEEYVDLGARAGNARRMEARLIEMLASRTGKLSEVLTVEQELTRVREEIERYEARLRFLEKRATMSTLSVSMHEPRGLMDNPRQGPLAEAVGLAWRRTVSVVAWCVASLGVIVPLAFLAALGVALVRRLRTPRLDASAS